jgi:hypothetical protein
MDARFKSRGPATNARSKSLGSVMTVRPKSFESKILSNALNISFTF